MRSGDQFIGDMCELRILLHSVHCEAWRGGSMNGKNEGCHVPVAGTPAARISLQVSYKAGGQPVQNTIQNNATQRLGYLAVLDTFAQARRM